MMDEQSKQTLAEIVAKEPAALSESEIAFLKARRSYLTEHEKSVFVEILAEAPTADQSEDQPAEGTEKVATAKKR